jgi:hypothetical protein
MLGAEDGRDRVEPEGLQARCGGAVAAWAEALIPLVDQLGVVMTDAERCAPLSIDR